MFERDSIPADVLVRRKTHAMLCCVNVLLSFFASFGALILIGGCSPVPPSMAVPGPPVVSWDHLLTEQWRYRLDSDTKIVEYRFMTGGDVSCTIGTHGVVDPVHGDVPLSSAYGVVCDWEIDDSADLLIRGFESGQTGARLWLLSLDERSANVRDLDTGESLWFKRTYLGR